jgi:hypothetical protein
MSGLERRGWVYVMPPAAYEIAPCECGNHDTQWSEFKGHLWCGRCEKDFVPEHNGVFDGPIPLHTATLLGMCFDRIDLATGERIPANVRDGGDNAADSIQQSNLSSATSTGE